MNFLYLLKIQKFFNNFKRMLYKESHSNSNSNTLRQCNEINKEIEMSDGFIENNNLLISILIPMYNEENTIKNVLERIPNHHKYEIILVDDGSTDNSLKRIKEIKQQGNLDNIFIYEKPITITETALKYSNNITYLDFLQLIIQRNEVISKLYLILMDYCHL